MFPISICASLKPVALMKITETKDVDELLKKHDRDNLVVEHKYDGWRLQVIKDKGKVKLYSRKGKDVTEKFPSLTEAISLPDGTMVEGEIVYWHKNKQDLGKVTSVAGSTVENALKKLKELPGTFKFHAYDIMWHKGKDVSSKGFGERRKLLESVIKKSNKVQITKQYPFSSWQKAITNAVSSGGEGIIIKVKDKSYQWRESGQREARPAGVMYKYKGGSGKNDSDDFVVYDYKVSEKGKLNALFGQYYKGKLYHISEISNFSKDNCDKIKEKSKKGHFVIEIGFQERVPKGMRHQKFIRFRDDKKPKDATMHEYHAENIDKLRLAKEAKFLISKRAAYIDDILDFLHRKYPRSSRLAPVEGVDVNKVYEVVTNLEARSRFAIGDSGSAFGTTQVLFGSFLNGLAIDPKVRDITGFSPSQLRSMSRSWRSNVRKLKGINILKAVPVDEQEVRNFMKKNRRKVVPRKGYYIVRYFPNGQPGAVIINRVGGKMTGYVINKPALQQAGLDTSSPRMNREIARIARGYITKNVVRNALSMLFTYQEMPNLYDRFMSTFRPRKVNRSPELRQLADGVNKRDLMRRINTIMSYIRRSGYNTNHPDAFNVYQLILIGNASGLGAVKRFLIRRKPFYPGNLSYLIRANPRVRKLTGLPAKFPPNHGMAGFPSKTASLKTADEVANPYDDQVKAIRYFLIEWLSGKISRSDAIQATSKYDVRTLGYDYNNETPTILLTVGEDSLAPLKEKLPALSFTDAEGNDKTYQIEYSTPLVGKEYSPAPSKEPVDPLEFERRETKVDYGPPTLAFSLLRLPAEASKAAIEEYRKIRPLVPQIRQKLIEEGNYKDEQDIEERILAYLLKKYGGPEHVANSKFELSKRGNYSQSGALYFPGQYAEDIKSGKREMTIRPADLPVKVEEVVNCVTYSGAPICKVKITSKEVMSLKRIEKAFGKRIANSLERKFGPNRRFVVIRFQRFDDKAFSADDGNKDENGEKWSEILIEKDGKKLSRGKIREHYSKPSIRKKIMARIKDKPILLYIGTGTNQKILKRNHNGKNIIITNDDTGKDENPNNYFYWVKRRMLSIHGVLGPKTDLGFVDLDIHGDYSLADAKKYAKALSRKIKEKFGVSSTIYESGGDGLHVEFNLKEAQSVNKLRDNMKSILSEFNDDWEGVTTGVVKGSGMRSDISTLHNKGSLRVPGALGESHGKVKKPVGATQDSDDSFDNSTYGIKHDRGTEDYHDLEGDVISPMPYRRMVPVNPGAYHSSDDGKFAKVLMMVAPKGFYEKEYFPSRRIFAEENGFHVTTASSENKAQGESGTVIDIDANLSDVNVDKYDALFVSGGPSMSEFSKNKDAQTVIKKFNRKNKPIALICSSPLLAVEAGITRGREITGSPKIMRKVKSKSVWTGMPFEKDGLLFSAADSNDAGKLAYVLSDFLKSNNDDSQYISLGPEEKINYINKLANYISKLAMTPEEKIQLFFSKNPGLSDEEKEFWQSNPDMIPEDEQDEVVPEEPPMQVMPQTPAAPTAVIERETPKKDIPEEDKDMEDVLKSLVEVEKPPAEEVPEDIPEEMSMEYLDKYMDLEEDDEDLEDLLSEPQEVSITGGLNPDEVKKWAQTYNVNIQNLKIINGSVLRPITLGEWPADGYAGNIEKPEAKNEAQDKFLNVFSEKAFKDPMEMSRVFGDPLNWLVLQNSQNAQLLQSWVLPHIMLLIGKRWFDSNKYKLGAAKEGPYKMYTDHDLKGHVDNDGNFLQGHSWEDLPKTAVYKSLINAILTDKVNTYLSWQKGVYDQNGYRKTPISPWLYRSLDREMTRAIAFMNGYKERRYPVCSVCKSKEKNPKVSVPSMKRIGKNVWQCEKCYKSAEDKQIELGSITASIKKSEEKFRELAHKVTLYKGYIDEVPADRKEMTEEKYGRALDAYNSYVATMVAWQAQRKALVDEISTLSQQTMVPFLHINCPNASCLVKRVPLTSIDWQHDFWKTEESVTSLGLLKTRFGIVPPKSVGSYSMVVTKMPEGIPKDKADEIVLEKKWSKSSARKHFPPEALLDVPFVCPHDGERFSPRKVIGKVEGYLDAGLLWEPWTKQVWFSEEKAPATIVGPSSDEIHQVGGYEKMGGFAQKVFSKLYWNYYSNLLEWVSERAEKRARNKRLSGSTRESPLIKKGKEYWRRVRMLSLYNTLRNFVSENPKVYVGWLAGKEFEKSLVQAGKRVSEYDIITTAKRYSQEYVYLPILQQWIDNMMKHENGFDNFLINEWLVNKDKDGIPSDGPVAYGMDGTTFSSGFPGTFFLAKVSAMGSMTGNRFFGAECNLRASKKRRGTNTSLSTRMLRVIGLWSVDEDDIKAMGLNENQINGEEYVPAMTALNSILKRDKDKKIVLKKANRISEMNGHDYKNISLSGQESSFVDGEYVLVEALLAPGNPHHTPFKIIRKLKNDNEDGLIKELGYTAIEGDEDVDFWNELDEELKKMPEGYSIERILNNLKKESKGSFRLSKRGKNSLSTYKSKRKFNKTPEPEGKPEDDNKYRFVIQHHQADKAGLHFDLRLENDDGAMSSWAIPKHKLPKNKEKLLAVKTEDHPVSYMSFKGVIPKGEYGAGKMEIHDSGKYKLIECKEDKIVFELNGKKEKGTYGLIKTDGKKWLLIPHKKEASFKLSSRLNPINKTPLIQISCRG